jgi:hypothetical protein
VDTQAAAAGSSRDRLFGYLAPAALVWVYLGWISAVLDLDLRGQFHVLRGLLPLQCLFILAGVVGGVRAFWLPSRALRIAVASGTLFGVIALYWFAMGFAIGAPF